ncbi:hypothetical protein HanIR_Chr12g0577221 [Helianthus annuus]|nr:hypothetical protein HanIR_Chr12g0577221 [Helianthus annuus]
MSPWFSLLSHETWAHSSSSCLCFLTLDRLADSRFDIILLCFLSLMITWPSSVSFELLELLQLKDGEKLTTAGIRGW